MVSPRDHTGGGAAWLLLRPVTALALAAALLVGGAELAGPAEGTAADVAPPAGLLAPERVARATASRMTAQAHDLAAASRKEALWLAVAALDAADAVTGLRDQAAPQDVQGFAAAVDRLTGLVAQERARQADVTDTVLRGRPDRQGRLAAAPTGAGVPDAGGPAPSGTVEQLAHAAQITAASSEVFQLSFELELLAQAAAEREVVTPAEGLATVEGAAAAARGAAAALAARAPLRPLVDDQTVAGRPGSVLFTVPELVQRWHNGRIPTTALCPVPFAPDELLQCDAAAALARLNVAHRAEFGTDLEVVSSYRSLEGQIAVRHSRGHLAAEPGTSNHGWGIAVDLGGVGGLGQFTSPRYLWLKEHAPAFGWHHPPIMEPGGGGPQEPWHWEFWTS